MIARRRCGNSELELPVLGAGCWAFGGGEYWGAQAQADVNAVVRRAVELGVHFFDTAEAYNDGRSEESLGIALRDVPRDQVLVGTKISPSNTAPDQLAEHCDASLRRLGTDYVDLYMVHWPITPHSIRHFTQDEDTIRCPPSAAAAFGALSELRRQGKIRWIGVSNFGATRLTEALDVCPDLVVNELPWNLLARAIELDILPFCRQNGIGVLGYMTLMQGLLADIYPTLKDVPPWQRRTRHFHHRGCDLTRHDGEGAEAETDAALAAIRALAREAGMSVPELALKWALAGDGITCCLVGARTAAELEANVRAAAEPLEASLIEQLQTATQPLLDALGPSFDYYESPSNDRTR